MTRKHLLLLLVVPLAVAGASAAASRRHLALHRRVANALADERPLLARLTGSRRWSACPLENADSTAPTGTTPASVACPAAPTRSAAIAAGAAVMRGDAFVAPERDMDGLWSAAVLRLASTATRPDAIDAAIDELTRAASLDPANAGILNDLAVAHLARAALRSEPASVYAALDAVERAARRDSSSSVVLFNRALIYERAHLYELAEGAWARYLAVADAREWRAEARAHVDSLTAAKHPPVAGRAANVADVVSADPQNARERAIDVELPAWAAAASAGDHAAADSIADGIRNIGRELAGRRGDSSVAHVAAGLAAEPQVATAVGAFAREAALYRKGSYQAQSTRTAALILRAARQDAVADWADLLVAGIAIFQSDFRAADSVFARVAGSAARRHDIALRGRAVWGRALVAAREGRTASAAELYAEAGDLFSSLGELPNEASMQSQLADVLFVLGDDDAALRAKYGAMRIFDERRNAAVRAGPLLAFGRQLAEAGLPVAGIAVLNEAVASARFTGRPTDLPEALLRLSAAELGAGDTRAGSAHFDSARVALRAVTDPSIRARLSMDSAATRAVLATTTSPREAIAHLDSVIAYYGARRMQFNLTPLVQRSLLNLRLGDTAASERDLAAAIAAMDSLTIPSADAASRRAFAAVRRDAYHTLIGIRVARGDSLAAFLLAERGRGSVRPTVPKGEVGEATVSYVVLPEAVVAWVVTPGGLRMHRTTISETELSRLAEAVRKEVSDGRGTSTPGDAAARLYELLIAPLVPTIGEARAIDFVTDGPLDVVPFAGLRDASGRFLIERFAVSYSSQAAHAGTIAVRGSDSVAIVGNPEFDPSLFPGLEPLREASREADRVKAIYAHASMVGDATATKRAVLERLQGATVFHFAGHARLVPHAPQLSHLVVARAPGGIAANTITAAEIAALDLRRVRLVVLSSCGTTQTRSRRDVSESGLSSAFLDAGAGGVVSSLWEVEDSATAPLMSEFHARLAVGASPANALRSAQVAAIRAGGGKSWAAFRYERR